RVEIGSHEAWDPLVMFQLSRMCEGRNPMRFVNASKHLFGRGADPRLESGTSTIEPAIERLIHVRPMPRSDQPARDPRTPGRLRWIGEGRSQDCFRIEVNSMRSQMTDHRAGSVDTSLTLLGEKGEQ